MSSGRRKIPAKKINKPQNLVDILKSYKEFDEVTEIKKSEDMEAVSFKLRNINLVLEKHSSDKLKLLRLINSFNPKGIDVDKDPKKLIQIANQFNRGSIGIKCSISEFNGMSFIVFTIEEIATNEAMLNLSCESIHIISAILAGAPALFEKLGKEK